MEEKALGLAVVEAVSEMKRIGGSRHKRVSCTLVILNLLQAVFPAAIGVSSLNAAELPELGITEKSSKEQSIFSRDFDSFIAGEAIRLASPFSSGLTEQTVLDKMKDSTYRHESNEMDTRFSFDSEKEYWINSAKSQAESYLNDRLESGASKVVGTVRSELKFDEHMKLSGYAFDVLSPFYENDYNTFFLQLGVRNNSSTGRSFLNVGLGHRYLSDSWMLGYNTFFDYELKRGHRRIGVGAEGAVDYVKAAINYYHPLSTWRDSFDIEEHEEMPAKGVDARFKAYLPSYPQLGATATYEQYFGDDVSMGMANELEKNPHASSLGIEWTPFPFMTAGLANKWTKGSGSELGVDLSFNFQLGSSFYQMFSSDMVATERLVGGMRHDLVERNNEIVLQYRKKAPEVTITHEPVFGLSGQTIQLSPVVTGGNGIVSWRWRANALPGMPDVLLGFSDASISAPSVTLPLLPIDTLITEYSLYLDATLGNGDVVSSEAIPLIVRADIAAFERQINIISHPDGVVELSANPVTVEWVLERTVGDASLSVTPIESNIQPTNPNLIIEVQPGRPADNGGWINSFVLFQSGGTALRESLIGQVNIQAKAIASLPLVETTADIVTASDPTQFQSARLEITANNAIANGTASNEVSAVVVDSAGEPLAEQQVTFSADNGAIIANPIMTTDEQGKVTTTLTSLIPGQSVVTARLDNGKTAQAQVTFQLDAGPDVSKSSLVTSRNHIAADGVDEATITLMLKDMNDNPLSGKVISFRSSLPGTSVSDVVDHSDGSYTASLVGVNAGETSVDVMLDGQVFGVTPVRVSLVDISVLGNAVVGEALIARCSGGPCSARTTYQWQVERIPGGDFINIQGATGQTYFVTKEDQKKRIQVVVSD